MAKIKLILAMVIFGTIGIFVRYIPLPSPVIALVRGVVGTIFLLAAVRISGKTVSKEAVRRNLTLLILSGGAIGINWILLFEAYRYTTVATATLCYYLAPVFVILLSPVLLKERLTGRKLVCVAGALAGMVMISGVMQGQESGGRDFTGILLGMGAAVFYACVILLNKFLRGISSYDSTVVQLGASAAVILPYVLLTEQVSGLALTGPAVILLLAVGIIHTGIAYWLYFSSLPDLDGQTIAVFSYVDPAAAILLSALFLGETMDGWSFAGAALILGSTLINEWKGKRHELDH